MSARMTEVSNIHRREEFDVYVGRPGRGYDGYFGNPIRVTGSREECLEAFRAYFNDRIENDAEYASRVAELKGKRLGCFCVPKLCHAMIYVEYLEGVAVVEQVRLLEEREAVLKRAKAEPSIFDELCGRRKLPRMSRVFT